MKSNKVRLRKPVGTEYPNYNPWNRIVLILKNVKKKNVFIGTSVYLAGANVQYYKKMTSFGNALIFINSANMMVPITIVKYINNKMLIIDSL